MRPILVIAMAQPPPPGFFWLFAICAAKLSATTASRPLRNPVGSILVGECVMLIWPMSNVETGDAMNIIILKKRVGNIRTPFISL